MEISDELRAALAAALNERKPNSRPAGPIAPPAILNDHNASPTARAHALDVYTAAIMEVPNNHWDKVMRDAVNEQCRSVLARGW
jgi:hypothetical protein